MPNNRARAGGRPTAVPCEECGTDVPAKPRGRLPRFCVPCLAARETAAAMRKHEQRRTHKRPGRAPRQPAQPTSDALHSQDVTEAVAARLVDRRLRIEQAKPLIRMAMLRPDRATPFLREALGLLDLS